MVRVLFIATTLVVLSALAAAQMSDSNDSDDETDMEEDTSEERKKNKGMAQMYMGAMMLKGFVGMIFSAIDTLVGVKSFGLSVIGTLINLARFLIQLKEHSQKNSAGQVTVLNAGGGNQAGGYGYEYKRVGTVPTQSWRPPPNYYYPYTS